jgi:hypothetical protein
MICATVPGRRHEIEIFSGGSMEVEVFGADGRIAGQDFVDDLLASRPQRFATKRMRERRPLSAR